MASISCTRRSRSGRGIPLRFRPYSTLPATVMLGNRAYCWKTNGRVTERQSAEEPLHLPVVGAEHAPGLIAHLEQQGVIVEKPPADPEAAVRSGDVPVILVVPEEHGGRLREAQPSRLELLVDASRNESRTPLRRTRRHLQAYGSQVAAMRLLARGVHPEVVRPVAVEEVDLATPQQHAANLLNMVPVFVMLAAFIG